MASGSVCRPDVPPTYRNTYREQPLPMQRAPAPSPEALTLEQRQFAAEQHNLIYAYLNEKGLYHEEYYDIAAFGYLQAVKRYLSQPALRQYAFSTIAWRAMRQSIAAFHRSEERRKAAERAFAESQPVATDAWDALEGSLILHDLAVISSREQYALTQLRLQGYSIREAALAQGISPKRVRKLLKELYRVYLALTSPVVDTTE